MERIKEIVKLIMIVKVILSVQTVMKTFALREKIGIALMTAAGGSIGQASGHTHLLQELMTAAGDQIGQESRQSHQTARTDDWCR